MCAMLGDAAMVEHDQAIHARDGGEPVRDRDHGLARHQGAEALLDRGLDLAVECGGGFVQHQDRRVLEDHARDRDALALAAGELDAALAHLGVVAEPPRQSSSEAMNSSAWASFAAATISASLASGRP